MTIGELREKTKEYDDDVVIKVLYNSYIKNVGKVSEFEDLFTKEKEIVLELK